KKRLEPAWLARHCNCVCSFTVLTESGVRDPPPDPKTGSAFGYDLQMLVLKCSFIFFLFPTVIVVQSNTCSCLLDNLTTNYLCTYMSHTKPFKFILGGRFFFI